MTRTVFVHRYRYSHEKRRKQLRRAVKDGQARVIERRKDGWLYEVSEEVLTRRR